MIKKLIYSLLIIILIFITGCSLKNNKINQNNNVKDDTVNNSNEVINSMKLIINEKEYLIALEDNETVKSFINLLPLELNMNELNGNEKYAYLDTTLPTNSYNPIKIESGDIMIYGNNCLVIFYRSFKTSYSYTKIGHIDNLPDLGSQDIFAKFEYEMIL